MISCGEQKRTSTLKAAIEAYPPTRVACLAPIEFESSNLHEDLRCAGAALVLFEAWCNVGTTASPASVLLM